MSAVLVLVICVLLLSVGGGVGLWLYLRRETYRLARGVDFPGYDLSVLETGTVASCKEACDATTGCVGFVGLTTTPAATASEIQGCWLKSSLNGPTMPDANRLLYTRPKV